MIGFQFYRQHHELMMILLAQVLNKTKLQTIDLTK